MAWYYTPKDISYSFFLFVWTFPKGGGNSLLAKIIEYYPLRKRQDTSENAPWTGWQNIEVQFLLQNSVRRLQTFLSGHKTWRPVLSLIYSCLQQLNQQCHRTIHLKWLLSRTFGFHTPPFWRQPKRGSLLRPFSWPLNVAVSLVIARARYLRQLNAPLSFFVVRTTITLVGFWGNWFRISGRTQP